MARQYLKHQRIGIEGLDQLDLARSVARLRPSNPDGQALVVRGAQHDLPGYAKQPAGFRCGQPAADIQLDERC